MDKIKLYRKGGRKPWVFELIDGAYTYDTRRGNVYNICFNRIGDVRDGLHEFIDIEQFDGVWRSVTKQIHADHFTLGNVTITF